MKFKGALLIFSSFFTYIGYYALLLLFIVLGLSDFSRYLTIPLRITIVLSLFFLWYGAKTKKILWSHKLLIVFFIIYFLRIVYDFLNLEIYYLGTSELVLYFFSFAVFPYYFILNVKLSKNDYHKIFLSILVSGVLFSFLSSLFYSKYVGNVTRLTNSNVGENVLSPLALSYSAALNIGLLVVYIQHHAIKNIHRVFAWISVVLSIIPLFLGASRGSIFALLIPILIANFQVNRSFAMSILRVVVVVILGIYILVFIDNKIGSGLVERILSTQTDIENQQSSAIRTIIWDSSWNQFLNHPVFGDKLRVNNWNGYPHNILFESLQTTGLIGFILLMYILSKGITLSFKILKIDKKNSWISVLFLQAFIQQLFSGAIYTGSWLWAALALIFNFSAFRTNELLLKK